MIPVSIPDSCISDYRELTEEDREFMIGFYFHPKTDRCYYYLFKDDSTTELVPTMTNEEFNNK